MRSTHSITLLHQILIVDGDKLPSKLPPLVARNIAALKALYPEAEYRMWRAEPLRELLQKNFEPAVLSAFDIMRPYSFKADLARFCILYLYGGLYVDIGMLCLNQMRPPITAGLASFKDYDLLSPSWTAVAGGITWALPGRNEFRIAIDYVVQNCEKKYYGANPLYPTGPVLFGRALIAAMAEKRQEESADDQWIGVSRPLTPGRPQANIAYIAPDHSLIAIRAKTEGGDLTGLGLSGTNNYNTLWHKKEVYGETEHFWTFADPAIRLTENARRTERGIAQISGEPGLLTFGPYIDLDSGRYHIKIRLENATDAQMLRADVLHDGRDILCQIDGEMQRSGADLEFDFTTLRPIKLVEFRIWSSGHFSGHICEIRLQYVQTSSNAVDKPVDSAARLSSGDLSTGGGQSNPSST